MTDATQPPPAGWYHDGTTMRWWDGSAWGPAAPPGSFGPQPADPVSEGTTMAVLCHVAMFFAAALLPLVIRLTEGKKNEYVRHHSTEALNFQLTFLIVWIVGIFTTMLGMFAIAGSNGGDASVSGILPFLTLFAVLGLAAVCSIVGAVRSSQGRWWRYPISIRFVGGARPKGPDAPR